MCRSPVRRISSVSRCGSVIRICDFQGVGRRRPVYSIVFLFTPAFACAVSSTPDVMLIGIAVALNAIIEITDAFLDMLAANVVRCVLVAAIAGVAAVVVSNMAGHAAGIVVAIKLEIFAVIERRRCPLILVVALAAVAGNLPVQRVGRRFVACLG